MLRKNITVVHLESKQKHWDIILGSVSCKFICQCKCSRVIFDCLTNAVRRLMYLSSAILTWTVWMYWFDSETDCISLISLIFSHSSELLRCLDSHYQQLSMTGQNLRAVTALVVLQTHLFLCAPDPILMIRRSKAAPARPVEMLQCPVFRWSPAAFSSCVSVTGFHVSRAHTVLHCAAHGSVWMGLLTGSLSTAPARPRTEEHGSRLTHLAGTAHHVPPAQTKATLYWRLLVIIPSSPLSAFIKTRKMKMKERASCTYTLLKIKVP